MVYILAIMKRLQQLSCQEYFLRGSGENNNKEG